MPKIHTIEDKNYYLVTDIDGHFLPKADVEKTIAERTGTLSKRARDAESQVETLTSEAEKAGKRLKTVDTLAEQVEALKGQLASAEARYERHSAVAAAGITDPDVRELVEWQYERATKEQGDKAPKLADWLAEQVKTPDKAPASLRPHLQSLKVEGGKGDDKGGEGGAGGSGDDKGGGGGKEGDSPALSFGRWASAGRGLQQTGAGNGGGITIEKIAGVQTEEQLAALEKQAGFR